MRYQELRLRIRPRWRFSLILVVLSQPAGKDHIWKMRSSPDYLMSLMWTDLPETPGFTLMDGFHKNTFVTVNAVEKSWTARRFLLSSRLINGHLWKHRPPLFFYTKNTMTEVIWGICSIWASCGTFVAALWLQRVCFSSESGCNVWLSPCVNGGHSLSENLHAAAGQRPTCLSSACKLSHFWSKCCMSGHRLLLPTLVCPWRQKQQTKKRIKCTVHG